MNTKVISAWLKKHPFAAACVGLSLVLLGAYFFRQDAVPQSETLLADRTAESRRLKSNITNSASLKEQVAALEEASRKVDQRLVRLADLAKNQQYFYKIEAETGVKITDLRPGGAASSAAAKPPAGVKKHYSSVPYSCSVQGTYTQLLSFLRKVEEGEHFQRILTATVSMAGGSGEDDAAAADPTLSLSINIEFLGQS
jgi:Tfp pilus assembly protein PilO